MQYLIESNDRFKVDRLAKKFPLLIVMPALTKCDYHVPMPRYLRHHTHQLTPHTTPVYCSVRNLHLPFLKMVRCTASSVRGYSEIMTACFSARCVVRPTVVVMRLCRKATLFQGLPGRRFGWVLRSLVCSGTCAMCRTVTIIH